MAERNTHDSQNSKMKHGRAIPLLNETVTDGNKQHFPPTLSAPSTPYVAPTQSVEEGSVRSARIHDQHVTGGLPPPARESSGTRSGNAEPRDTPGSGDSLHPMVDENRNSDYYTDVHERTSDSQAPTTQAADDKSDTGATTYGDTGVEPDEHSSGSRATEPIAGHYRNTPTQSPSSTSTRSTHNTDGGTEGTAYDEEEGTDGPKESCALTGLPPFREHSHSDDE